MAKFNLTAETLAEMLAAIPEGCIFIASLHRYAYGMSRRDLEKLEDPRFVLNEGFYVLNNEAIRARFERCRYWYRPRVPAIQEGRLVDLPIVERIAQRDAQLANDPALQAALTIDAADGVVRENSDLDADTRMMLIARHILFETNGIAYDPLLVGEDSARQFAKVQTLDASAQKLTDFLNQKPGAVATQQEIVDLVGEDTFKELLTFGPFARFSISMPTPPYTVTYVRFKSTDLQTARRAALQIVEVPDTQWEAALERAGSAVRPNTEKGLTSARQQVLQRTYTVKSAAKRLDVQAETVEVALNKALLLSFTDPEGVIRLPAEDVEAAREDASRYALITDEETIRVRDLEMVTGFSYPSLKRRLKRLHVHGSIIRWAEIRGQWELPQTLAEFHELLRGKLAERRAEREAVADAEWSAREQERQRRRDLRARLVASFPTWQHAGRSEQRIILHIGPPNSGKTHEALNALSAASSGWYLAPLRLLAFEIFDRLNRRGVRCNLLTGEEFIPVEGATVTAATVEMFNPYREAECIIIDEAQLLADPDRGWAWTRALMEAQAPEIHVIAPPTARALIERMASAAAIPISTVQHERLAPIEVAESPWNIHDLPPRTLLIAFSRQTVLELKLELERARRSVSVVYGSLPPEVRRKQADRFASEETEICISTDAVGMGLNLPADYVCFYEVHKFDGRAVRPLTPAEVQQIGGRAGRYGLSRAGEVGATTSRDLKLVRRLFYTEPEPLTHARVAPTVSDLELIPGTLAERLAEWASLKSIPDALRGALETADLTERTELARMLTREEVARLGMAGALQLVNAPTRQSSRDYWYDCAKAILSDEPLPLPPTSSATISDAEDLERLEAYISYADIYMWLSNRKEFYGCGPQVSEVREMRSNWSNAIDDALVRRLATNTRRRAPRPPRTADPVRSGDGRSSNGHQQSQPPRRRSGGGRSTRRKPSRTPNRSR